MSSPSIAPGSDNTVHIVINDFGMAGRAFVETDVEAADLETIIQNIRSGQYTNPLQIVSFNIGEGWSRDVTEDIAIEMLRRAESGDLYLVDSARDFVEYHTGKSAPQEV